MDCVQVTHVGVIVTNLHESFGRHEIANMKCVIPPNGLTPKVRMHFILSHCQPFHNFILYPFRRKNVKNPINSLAWSLSLKRIGVISLSRIVLRICPLRKRLSSLSGQNPPKTDFVGKLVKHSQFHCKFSKKWKQTQNFVTPKLPSLKCSPVKNRSLKEALYSAYSNKTRRN